MGSVKNLTVSKAVTENEMGIGVFSFTDDYSIFDYGKMPETLPGKGEALCRMAAYNFEQLGKKGIKTHFRKLVSGNEMEVNLVRVLFPQKGEVNNETKNYLVPLEVMFRNSLPSGSSVFKRLDSGQLKPSDMGLEHLPRPGEILPKPFIDVSTKLEETDRYLTWHEAQELAAIEDHQLEELKIWTKIINNFITEKAAAVGLVHADGKVEYAITPENKPMLVDVCGTLDENRMLFNNVHVSKQVLRDYYKTTPWYGELMAAMKSGVGKENYPKPELLPAEMKEIASNMYKSVCEAWIGEKIWGSPKIYEVVDSYLEFLEKGK
ncbi:MAG: phosphoribosylaminoimidazolesuccinocarboxamide synthase [Candidatus Diapherotrites archaeon]